MNTFLMNGYLWKVRDVSSTSPMLIDRTGEARVATTDPVMHTVYLSDDICGEFRTTVLLHELGHCVMFSYGLIDQIHSMVEPEYWVEAEEWICNFIADYGREVFSIVYEKLGDEAWQCIPYELERIIA